MLNALTIDVEDYYQVSAFESVVRFEDWDRYESRVEKNTHRILDILDEHKTSATFFVLGWIAERRPGLVRTIHECSHTVLPSPVWDTSAAQALQDCDLLRES